MKALVYTNVREVTHRDEPEPFPPPGEALVNVGAVGVCGSDMHAYLEDDSRRVPQLNRRYEANGRASALGDVLQGRCASGRIVLIP